MDDLAIARALHVASVILWIGGVAFVTTVLLPAVRRLAPGADKFALFVRTEGLFAWQARVTTLLAGGSGLYMIIVTDAWSRFAEPSSWWLHAMVLVWLVFTVMLFVLEPLILHRWFQRRARRDADGTLAIIQRLHWLLLGVSLITAAGAVIGVHG